MTILTEFTVTIITEKSSPPKRANKGADHANEDPLWYPFFFFFFFFRLVINFSINLFKPEIRVESGQIEYEQCCCKRQNGIYRTFSIRRSTPIVCNLRCQYHLCEFHEQCRLSCSYAFTKGCIFTTSSRSPRCIEPKLYLVLPIGYIGPSVRL